MSIGNALALNCAVGLLVSMAAGPASAQSRDWLVHLGPAVLSLADKSDMRLGGTPLAGSGLDSDPQYTAAVEISRFVAPSIAVSLTLGVPPVAEFDGTGSIEALGRLGSARYGPVGLTVQWHPMRSGRFQPYIGAGGAYMHFFSIRDGALTDIELDNDVGPLVQVGVQYFFTDRMGVFVDARKAWLRTNATASFAGLPVEADLRFDPVVLNAGLALRF